MSVTGFAWECSCGHTEFREEMPEECLKCGSLENFIKMPEEIIKSREQDILEQNDEVIPAIISKKKTILKNPKKNKGRKKK